MGTTSLPRLARSIPSSLDIADSSVCVQNKSALFVNLFIIASSVCQEYLLYYHQYSNLNMQVESSATPVLTGDKAQSLAGQVCRFHPLSTLQLLERAEGFCYEHCPAWENVLYVVFPLLQNGKGTYNRVDRPSCTLMWNNVQLSWSVIVFTSMYWEKINSI